ncbi:Inner membrane protein YohK [Rhodobacteraceae bacterium THAF1]|uniref:LrgB family protein n=1 Tax=Palleronia sp. THAF1 TaxID=2587842 RepID=UPI000F3C86E4|nr:LrgB family protein [Palleronia sp. THAF1]QFU08034.1 Inner membrane protein YohK [Palleronia sp. THAF1]VDC27887.1 Inner membrane protein YohK [Rhodobacteraceae bacterium THAF1]
MTDAASLWSYLAQEPLLWLTLTLVAYLIADRIAGWAKHPLANPVLIAVILVGAVLVATDIPYARYFEGAQFVHFMLGPATVALALPLFENAQKLRRAVLPMVLAVLAGTTTAILSALGVAWALGVRGETLLSVAPKSATAPVALGVAEQIGALPSLTAVLVVLTGISGAVIATPMLNALGFTDWRARGFAVGLAAHGIGTAHAFRVNSTAGTFAGIGMGLGALTTAILCPLIVALLF